MNKVILNNFRNVRVVNELEDNHKLDKIGIISGFGLKNPDYIKLAHEKKLDILISGDLCQETAILAKNLNLTLIDLGHHESEIPGLFKLAEILDKLDVNIEIIDKKPIDKLK
jgi:putative NIF3 family GTP cyclohydrolase 1 type 2